MRRVIWVFAMRVPICNAVTVCLAWFIYIRKRFDNTCFIVNCMLLCPEQIHTSPNMTSLMVTSPSLDLAVILYGPGWLSCGSFNFHTPPDKESIQQTASILYKSIAGRYRPVRVADGPITARYRFIKNASFLYKSIAGRYRPVRVADEPITARCRFIKNASWANTRKIFKMLVTVSI